MEPEVNGIKSYPIMLAKAMEQLIRDLDDYEYRQGVGEFRSLQDRSNLIIGMLNKW